MSRNVWAIRWDMLKNAGMSFTQAKMVYEMLEASRLFGTATISKSAYSDLHKVFGKELPDGAE